MSWVWVHKVHGCVCRISHESSTVVAYHQRRPTMVRGPFFGKGYRLKISEIPNFLFGAAHHSGRGSGGPTAGTRVFHRTGAWHYGVRSNDLQAGCTNVCGHAVSLRAMRHVPPTPTRMALGVAASTPTN